MSSQHKRPILAFVVLAVLAAAVIGNQFRARADSQRFIAAGPIMVHSVRTQGTVPALVADAVAGPARATATAAADDSAAGTARGKAASAAQAAAPLPMASVLYDTVAALGTTTDDTADTHAVGNRAASSAAVGTSAVSTRPADTRAVGHRAADDRRKSHLPRGLRRAAGEAARTSPHGSMVFGSHRAAGTHPTAVAGSRAGHSRAGHRARHSGRAAYGQAPGHRRSARAAARGF